MSRRLLRAIGRSEAVYDATFRTRQHGAAVPLLGDLERVLRRLGAVATLHLLGQAPVETHLPRRIQLAVERVADESVGKVVDLRVAGRAHELRLERFIQGIERAALVQVGDGRRNLEAEDAGAPRGG